MGRIVVHENVTIDGIAQDPTGDEGFKRGGWFIKMPEAVREAWAKHELQEARESAAWLVGRGTYQWFAERWADRTGEWADRLRAVPKYVMSSTLDESVADWGNTTVVRGDVSARAGKLKQTVDGPIMVYGSRPLVHELFESDLVDELRLMTHPFVLGDGERLFGPVSDQRSMQLVDARAIGGALALLTYQRAV